MRPLVTIESLSFSSVDGFSEVIIKIFCLSIDLVH